jgi:hypothetical protein
MSIAIVRGANRRLGDAAAIECAEGRRHLSDETWTGFGHRHADEAFFARFPALFLPKET